MTRFLTILLSSLLTITLLLALVIIVITRFIDPNDYRDQISTLVQQKTGRELQLQGDLQFSVFPWLGIEVERLRLSQPAEIGFDQVPMLQVAEAQLRVRVLPLLKKQIEVDTVILKQPSLNLITVNNSLNSFTGLLEESELGQQAVAEQDDSSAKSALALLVKGVEISGAEVILHNQMEGIKTRVSEVDLFVGDILSGEYVSLDSKGVVATEGASSGKNDAGVPIAFELTSLFQVDIATSSAVLKDLDVTVNQGQLQGEFLLQSVRLDAQQASLHQASFNIEGMQLDGDAVTVDGELTKGQYGVDASTLALTDLTLKGQVYQREFSLALPALAGDLNKQTLVVDKLILDSDDLHMLLSNLKAEQIVSNPTLAADLNIAPFNLQQLLEDTKTPYETVSASALQSVQFNGSVKANKEKVSVQKINAQVDDSKLAGQLQIANFTSPNVTFDLSLDQLNVDNYLPVSTEANNSSKVPEGESSTDALIIPMTVFRELQANGSLSIGDLTASGINLKDINVNVTSEANQVSITPSASLYEGSLVGDVLFTESEGGAKLVINSAIKLVDLESLLSDADITQQLSGLGELAFNLEVDEVDGKQTNRGTINLSAKNGVIKGVDIQRILTAGLEAYNELRGRAVQEGDTQEDNETGFAELNGIFDFTDFAINNKDFVLKAPAFRISGEGDIDIAQQSLDYLLSIAVVNTTKGQGGEALADLRGLTLPIRFTGSIFAPNYSLDMKALYQSMAEKKVNEKKDRYLQRKVGVENASELSSKEILRQVLLKEIEKESKEKTEEGSEPTEAGEVSAEKNDQPVNEDNAEANTPAVEEELDIEDQLKKRFLEELFR